MVTTGLIRGNRPRHVGLEINLGSLEGATHFPKDDCPILSSALMSLLCISHFLQRPGPSEAPEAPAWDHQHDGCHEQREGVGEVSTLLIYCFRIWGVGGRAALSMDHYFLN